MNIVSFRPGEIVELKGKSFKVAACNYEGKIILHPLGTKESIEDVMRRLQSTTVINPTEE